MIEMIVVIVVMGAIFAAGGLVLGRAFESYALTQDATNVDWQGRVAIERMVREARNIRSRTPIDLTFAANPMTQLQFYDADNNAVCLFVNGGRLWRSPNAPGSACVTAGGQPLADNVSSLSVYYFTNAGVAPASVDQVYFITATLAVTEGSVSETYRATVQPRRF